VKAKLLQFNPQRSSLKKASEVDARRRSARQDYRIQETRIPQGLENH
jgi:hypothetical protein